MYIVRPEPAALYTQNISKQQTEAPETERLHSSMYRKFWQDATSQQGTRNSCGRNRSKLASAKQMTTWSCCMLIEETKRIAEPELYEKT